MLSVDLILSQIGDEIVSQIKSDIKGKSLVAGYPPPNASGALYNSIRYEVKDEKLTVYGLDYAYYLQHGRKKGKKPPRDVIRKWIDVKGIQPKPDKNGKPISKDSLAFLIQRAIGEKGTLIAQQGGSDFLSSIINESKLSQIKDQLIFAVVNDFKSEVLKIAA